MAAPDLLDDILASNNNQILDAMSAAVAIWEPKLPKATDEDEVDEEHLASRAFIAK